jgi:hypothetical protein
VFPDQVLLAQFAGIGSQGLRLEGDRSALVVSQAFPQPAQQIFYEFFGVSSWSTLFIAALKR